MRITRPVLISDRVRMQERAHYLPGASLRVHGFTDIVYIGDSGGNQAGMRQVAEELTAKWAGSGARAHFIPEYYDSEARQQWLRDVESSSRMKGSTTSSARTRS